MLGPLIQSHQQVQHLLQQPLAAESAASAATGPSVSPKYQKTCDSRGLFPFPSEVELLLLVSIFIRKPPIVHQFYDFGPVNHQFSRNGVHFLRKKKMFDVWSGARNLVPSAAPFPVDCSAFRMIWDRTRPAGWDPIADHSWPDFPMHPNASPQYLALSCIFLNHFFYIYLTFLYIFHLYMTWIFFEFNKMTSDDIPLNCMAWHAV